MIDDSTKQDVISILSAHIRLQKFNFSGITILGNSQELSLDQMLLQLSGLYNIISIIVFYTRGCPHCSLNQSSEGRYGCHNEYIE